MEPQYRCEKCDKKFTSKYGLQVHSLKVCSKNTPGVGELAPLGSFFGKNPLLFNNWGGQHVLSYETIYAREMTTLLSRLSGFKYLK